MTFGLLELLERSRWAEYNCNNMNDRETKVCYEIHFDGSLPSDKLIPEAMKPSYCLQHAAISAADALAKNGNFGKNLIWARDNFLADQKTSFCGQYQKAVDVFANAMTAKSFDEMDFDNPSYRVAGALTMSASGLFASFAASSTETFAGVAIGGAVGCTIGALILSYMLYRALKDESAQWNQFGKQMGFFDIQKKYSTSCASELGGFGLPFCAE